MVIGWSCAEDDAEHATRAEPAGLMHPLTQEEIARQPRPASENHAAPGTCVGRDVRAEPRVQPASWIAVLRSGQSGPLEGRAGAGCRDVPSDQAPWGGVVAFQKTFPR